MGILVENRSATHDELVFIHPISVTEDNPHLGNIVDTQGMSEGLTFVPVAFDLGVGEDYTFVINESDDSSMAGATPIDADRLVGELSDITFGNDSVEDSFLNAIGVFNTLRFIQVIGTSTNNTQGTVFVLIRDNEEIKPVVND